jgi:hypothetical protein
MQLELDERDAELLGSALESHVDELTRVLARTDQHTLQHELALMVSRLEVIAARLEAVRARQPVESGAASAR